MACMFHVDCCDWLTKHLNQSNSTPRGVLIGVVRVSEVPSKVFVFVFVVVFVFVFVFECSHVEWAGPGVW